MVRRCLVSCPPGPGLSSRGRSAGFQRHPPQMNCRLLIRNPFTRQSSLSVPSSSPEERRQTQQTGWQSGQKL